MLQTGLSFYISGEYSKDIHPDDPEKATWEMFTTTDIHPAGKEYFTAWSQFTEITDEDRERMVDEVSIVIDWIRKDRGWDGFVATLWQYRGDQKPLQVNRWELC